ncbi:MAG: FAD-dependent oxidoreductase [Leptolyngbyaceae cyanobacterium SM1_1_3]|nr:FAD-dependent oxidoreductase [Leptolyngbyaceae cyanobacterium SM1_1_3]
MSAIPTPPQFIAPQGITAVAKFLAAGLTLHRQCRVTAIERGSETWHIQAQTADTLTTLSARAVVLAIPAAQALDLITPLFPRFISTEAIAALGYISYYPGFSVMAGYPVACFDKFDALPAAGWQVEFANEPDLGWVGLENSKHRAVEFPLLVVQSSAAFAQTHLEAIDLAAVAEKLLQAAAERLLPWLNQPDWLQTHRWRYALTAQTYAGAVLPLAISPWLLGCGDWCSGSGAAAALQSGLAAADTLNQQLQQRSLLPAEVLWERLGERLKDNRTYKSFES